MITTNRKIPEAEAAILERLVEPGFANLSPELAERILAMQFGPEDIDRINSLSAKAQEGILTPEEDDLLDSYMRIGHMLSIMKSKARKALKKASSLR